MTFHYFLGHYKAQILSASMSTCTLVGFATSKKLIPVLLLLDTDCFVLRRGQPEVEAGATYLTIMVLPDVNWLSNCGE